MPTPLDRADRDVTSECAEGGACWRSYSTAARTRRPAVRSERSVLWSQRGNLNVSLNLATSLRESARQRADRVALVFGDRTWSYAELHDAVQRFAGALQALGVRRGQ